MKKILCLFLSLIMLLPAVVSQADDSNIISEVTVFCNSAESRNNSRNTA